MKLAVRELGNGAPVVFLHGCPVPPDYLVPFADALSDQHRVIVISLPGYGDSPALPGSYTLEAAQAAIEDTLIALGHREVALLGHSIGAYRALTIALAGRIRISRIAGLAPIADLPDDRRRAYPLLAAQIRAGADLRAVLPATMLAPAFAAARPDLVAEISRWWDVISPGVLEAELDAIARMPSLLPQLRSLEVDLLLRCGTEDPAVSTADAEEIKRHFDRPGRQAILQLVEGAGHSPIHDDRAATAKALLEFFGVGTGR